MNHEINAVSSGLSDDEQQLKALGYTSNFDRSMSLWENFALGFTYLSPVVGVYSVFAFGLASGGPPMLWAYFIAGFGQLLVALIFGEVVSQFPISGGLYPWSRRLVGRSWAWMAGWIYAWALFTTIAAVAVGAGPFLALLLGFEPSPVVITLIALAVLLTSTLLNLGGTQTLAKVAMFGFICELVGALVVGVYLLAFHREQPFDIVFHTLGAEGAGSYLPAFLTAALVGLFSCYGFEACGDVAEETPDPGRRIPMAMRMTIYIGVGASAFVCYALILAVPDIGAVISGAVTDPLEQILLTTFGPWGSKAVIIVVMVSFLSCVLSLQAAVSRLLFSYGRDRMIFGSGMLSRLSEGQHVPSAALVLAGIVPALIVVLGLLVEDALTTIISFAVVGIYVSFQMVVIGALYARSRGWVPAGKFRLGAWGPIVNILALTYGIGAVINMMWPRAPEEPWFVNYSMLLTSSIVVGAGLLYMVLFRSHERGTAPYADAWKLNSEEEQAAVPVTSRPA
ncbi:amino acid permease [Pseudochelatococcus contaminans]|uniref:Amino acid transporter n=1 Tax=Pseudochelatococcus contaminans TaxID=1538103 RepID=A0A7W5Z5T5_9HYPH|nr:amino acid transporter [Pseudochelatococcus contaminans]